MERVEPTLCATFHTRGTPIKTNTLSPSTLGEILEHVRKTQPKMCCVIRIAEPKNDTILKKWIFTGPTCRFSGMLGEIIKMFEITPALVRNKMSETLKCTIVNNIAQCVAKYNNGDPDNNVSITTVTRLVNMCDHLIYADFEDVDKLNVIHWGHMPPTFLF